MRVARSLAHQRDLQRDFRRALRASREEDFVDLRWVVLHYTKYRTDPTWLLMQFNELILMQDPSRPYVDHDKNMLVESEVDRVQPKNYSRVVQALRELELAWHIWMGSAPKTRPSGYKRPLIVHKGQALASPSDRRISVLRAIETHLDSQVLRSERGVPLRVSRVSVCEVLVEVRGTADQVVLGEVKQEIDERMVKAGFKGESLYAFDGIHKWSDLSKGAQEVVFGINLYYRKETDDFDRDTAYAVGVVSEVMNKRTGLHFFLEVRPLTRLPG